MRDTLPLWTFLPLAIVLSIVFSDSSHRLTGFWDFLHLAIFAVGGPEVLMAIMWQLMVE